MEVDMKRIRVLFGVALTAVVLVSIPVAYSRQAAPGPAERQAPAQADKATAEKTFSGQLSKVDTSAKLIAVKGPDQKDMMFNYNDDTQVISPDKTVQGLSGKTGAQLRISYREERGSNMATKIELVEK
jgi:hypothetical protein